VSERSRVEIWAGVECSYNRVGDAYVDQLERTGLYAHPDYLDRVADLGVTAVRFPVLWERYCALGERAWEFTDAALDRLRQRGIPAIVGLVHHGSGPPNTSLTDESFPEQLAAFAHIVAERYPWVDRYTPINEPLTTARFATLYGLWYPHQTSPRAFARAMIGQTRGIVQAMRAIRRVAPGAQLVQTEDLGKTYATGPLTYQADFENERRWLTFDLLLGRVVGDHPMATYLRWAGTPDEELDRLAEAACPPEVLGVNHYLTSERFLDHRLQRYPSERWGGNERHRYADVEAVRVVAEGVSGPYALLREAWTRYERPLAVTEAQLACTREQQLRWLEEVWDAATALRAEGADIRAVTAWSALGAHDWSSLLTRTDGQYEAGLFDIRGPQPRATAAARMIHSLASSGTFDHAVLRSPGWWQCEQRLVYEPVRAVKRSPSLSNALQARPRRSRRTPRPLLVIGAGGTLGRAVSSACHDRGLRHVALTRADLDVTDKAAIARVVAMRRPWAVVNCAGFVRVDEAEYELEACRQANTDAAGVLARECAEFGAKLVTFSTDLVFDGSKGTPYLESDAVRPLSQYGRTKADAESQVLAASSDALVIRTAAFFADHDDHNFVTLALRAMLGGRVFSAANDVVVSPTYVPDLVNAMLDLTIDDERGIWHLASAGALTWDELARHAAREARISTASLRGVPVAELALRAARPAYSALSSERGTLMAPLDDALARYARSRAWERQRLELAATFEMAGAGDGS
jgi:dTDP-4-dehydrorhamnose reductase